MSWRMGDIVNIEEGMPHKISEVICVKCLKRWLCVRPLNTWLKEIECLNCGAGYVIETGQIIEEE